MNYKNQQNPIPVLAILCFHCTGVAPRHTTKKVPYTTLHEKFHVPKSCAKDTRQQLATTNGQGDTRRETSGRCESGKAIPCSLLPVSSGEGGRAAEFLAASLLTI